METQLNGYFKSIAQLRQANEDSGKFFFSPQTMNFFKTKIETGIIQGRFFITSDADFKNSTRLFTIREIRSIDGDIINNPLNRKFSSLASAKVGLQNHLLTKTLTQSND